jgi:hypothetical protein
LRFQIETSTKSIIIIDNYIDNSILDLLSKKNDGVFITIISDKHHLNSLDIKKFNSQYYSLKIIISNNYHDRFIIIDNINLYHIGASLKDLGKKCFAISKIEDNNFIKNINEII